jgi:hypothetical protein
MHALQMKAPNLNLIKVFLKFNIDTALAGEIDRDWKLNCNCNCPKCAKEFKYSLLTHLPTLI